MRAVLKGFRTASTMRPAIRRQASFNKVKDFLVKAWKDTYPDEDATKTSFRQKVELKKKEAKLRREEMEKFEEMTEEEIEKVVFDGLLDARICS